MLHGSVLVRGGPVTLAQGVVECVRLANGPVAPRPPSPSELVRSVVVCRGDLDLSDGGLDSCVVVAAGSVRTLDGIFDSLVVAGGKVSAPAQYTKRSVIKAEQKSLLPFARFFDPAEYGVAAAPAEGGMTVGTAGQAFAAAGLTAGDLLVTVDGTKVGTADAFRSALLRALAGADVIELEVRRSGRSLTLFVPPGD